MRSVIRVALLSVSVGTLHGCSGIPYKDAQEMVSRVDIGIHKNKLEEIIPDAIAKDIKLGKAVRQETTMQHVPPDYCRGVDCSPGKLGEIINHRLKNNKKIYVNEILYLRYPTVCLSASFIFFDGRLIGKRLFKNESFICR